MRSRKENRKKMGLIRVTVALRAIGIKPIGKIAYGLADGTPKELEFGLGVTALESTGVILNPKNHTLKRLPAIPLKSLPSPSPLSV